MPSTNLQQSQHKDNLHVEYLTCCLDLLCVMVEALGSSIDPFIAQNDPSLSSKAVLPLLLVCMKDSRQEVRQSAFALVGELARARVPSLLPALPEYISSVVDAMSAPSTSVSNNATWALAELVTMAGFLPPAVPVNREAIKHSVLNEAVGTLIQAVNRQQLNKSLLENSALTLGRVGLILPDAIAPKLEQFAKTVFAALRNIRDDVEKEQAFHGLNAMIKLNPTAMLPSFGYYVDAIASWMHCKPDLEMEFASILSGYKTVLGDNWFNMYSSLSPALQNLLKERFGL